MGDPLELCPVLWLGGCCFSRGSEYAPPECDPCALTPAVLPALQELLKAVI